VDLVLAHIAAQDCAVSLDSELCGVVGNNNMCWSGSPSGLCEACNASKLFTLVPKDFDKSGHEDPRRA
jgi:hypothetical protein